MIGMRRAMPALAVLAAAALTAAGCGGGPEGESSGGAASGSASRPEERAGSPAAASEGDGPAGTAGRVLVIAVDGMEWSLVLPLLAEGKLPALARLMEKGRFGKLATFEPTMSQIIWTSAVTGKTPEKHGITSLLKETDGARGARLYSSEDRKTEAIWNMLTDAGLRSQIVGWWKAWPVEPINGVMVPQLNLLYSFDASGMAVFRPERTHTIQALVHPEELRPLVARTAAEVEAGVASVAEKIFGRFRHPHSPLGNYMLPRMRWVTGMDEMHRRIALDLLRSGKPWNLTMVYFRGADVYGHAFWRFVRPAGYQDQPTADEIDNYGDLVPGYYRHMDTVIGELVEAAGPAATVFVVSDHGMESVHQDRAFSPGGAERPEARSGDHEDAPPGIFVAAGPLVTGGGSSYDHLPDYDSLENVGSIMDLTPTLLALLGLPVGDDMDGRVLENVIEPGWLAAHPVSHVATHDAPGWRSRDETYRFTDEQVQERIEELRSIGYIE